MDEQLDPREPNVVKRAFAIAPICGSIEEVKRRLIREGYMQVNAHLSGWLIRREILRKLNRDLVHEVPKRLHAKDDEPQLSRQDDPAATSRG